MCYYDSPSGPIARQINKIVFIFISQGISNYSIIYLIQLCLLQVNQLWFMHLDQLFYFMLSRRIIESSHIPGKEAIVINQFIHTHITKRLTIL